MTRISDPSAMAWLTGMLSCAVAFGALVSGCAPVEREPEYHIDELVYLEFRPVLIAAGAFALNPNADTLQIQPSAVPEPDLNNPSSLAWVTEELLEALTTLDCSDPGSPENKSMGDPDAGHVACSQDGLEKFALGPVELTGASIESADAGPELASSGVSTGRFQVTIEFTEEGGAAFDAVASRLYEFPLGSDQSRFAMVLDGVVITAPSVAARSLGGTAQISGNFTEDEARLLAARLEASR